MPSEALGINPTRLTGDASRPMPQDPEAESSILSAMLLSPDVLQECLIDLNEEDFYLPTHRTIFVAMRKMFDKALPIDTISLADYLRSQGELEKVGGRAFLLNIGGYTPALAGWQRHVEMIKRDAILRKMILASAQVTALAYDAPEDTKEVVDRAEKLILDVTNSDVKKAEQGLDEIMSAFYTQLSEASQNESGLQGVMTGFPSLDTLLLGMRAGQMVVIGARPGVGKTSLALTLAINAAISGASVAFFSLEMSKVEIAQRLLSSRTHIPLQNIRSAKINDDQWTSILQATEELSMLDVMIDDTSGTTVTEIRAKARRMLAKKELGLIIIDYLQLVSPPGGSHRADSRATEVAEMSRGIKIMAKDLGVPVIALSQLNRGLEGRTGKRPQLSDLRESGAIEQDADIVLLLDRSTSEEEASRDDRPNWGVTNLIVAKNRSGALADVPLTFMAQSTTFVEIDKRYMDE